MSNTCNDINKALNNLAKKIDAQNKCCEANRREINAIKKRLDKLEGNSSKELKNNKDSQSLAEILRRLAKAEKDILDLGGIIKNIIDDIKDILDSLDQHNENAEESTSIFGKILDFFSADDEG